MTADRSDTTGPDPFSSAPDSSREQMEAGSPSIDGDSTSMPGEDSGFALDLARLWVEEHQTTTMLGAFAVGVFVGALFRE
ncbi:MAG: hypothetical protein BRD35_01955 [Bacteroidetes bacterium QH_7_62_13]|nr:MAG: hypothetical protein BRD35_01955 [Bacteroidetes bacterium QH_7_62_13]